MARLSRLPLLLRVAALAGLIALITKRRGEVRATPHENQRDPSSDESLAIASHDIRSPLTAVVGYSGRLRAALASGALQVDEQRAEEIRLLARAAERMRDALFAMEDLASLGRGSLEVDAEPIRLNRLLGAEVDRVRDLHPHLPVTLVADEEAVIESDQRHVTRILRTLLDNAAKHAAAQPVEVALHATPEGASVTVRDHGPGIPAALRGEIFERAYTVDGERRHRSGLGLHLASRLAEALGGRLTLDDGTDGASFTLTLPEMAPEPR